MHRRILATLAVAGCGFLFAACTSTPEQAGTSSDTQPGASPGTLAQAEQRGSTTSASLAAAKTIPSQRSIYYDYDKYDIKPDYRGVVEAHAKYLRANRGAKILIQGNADERGSREYNVGLGQRRSDGLKQSLVLLGVQESQIESVSLGEEKPLCTEHAENCWWKNRRDDIRYPGEY